MVRATPSSSLIYRMYRHHRHRARRLAVPKTCLDRTLAPPKIGRVEERVCSCRFPAALCDDGSWTPSVSRRCS
jgi:hypothetical protein